MLSLELAQETALRRRTRFISCYLKACRRLDFAEDFAHFRALCGVQSSPLIFARNCASPFLYRVARYTSG